MLGVLVRFSTICLLSFYISINSLFSKISLFFSALDGSQDRKKYKGTLFLLAFLLLVPTSHALAQSRRPSTVIGPVTLGGMVGVSTETYRANGINDRRPAGSGRIFARTNATMYGVRYDIDFLLSTEDDQIRQAQNRFALSAQYKSWRVTAGDFSPRLNKFGLNGSTIRGGTLTFAPGNLLFNFMAGQSQRAIDTSIGAVIRRPSYRRNMMVAQVGYGEASKTHLHISGLIARDNPSSLSNPGSVTPAENVLITPQFGVHLLNNRLIFEGELTASAFSSNTEAARTTDVGTPSFFGLFTPRIGSRFDYASSFRAQYTHVDFSENLDATFDQFSIATTYERVAPGFVSMGRPYTRSDQVLFKINPSVQLLNKRVQIGLNVQTSRNNLDNSRTATLRRQQVGLTTQAQLSEKLFINTSYLWFSNANDPSSDSPNIAFLEQRFVTQSFMIAPVLSTQINGLTHRFSLTASFQSLRDKSPELDTLEEIPSTTIDFDNTSTTLTHLVVLSSGLSLNNSASIVNSSSSSTDVSAFGLQTGISYPFFKRKLSVGLLGGFSRTTLEFQPFSLEEDEVVENEQSTQWTFTLNSTYRFTSKDIIRFTIRGLTTNQPYRGNFREFQSMLRYEHRF